MSNRPVPQQRQLLTSLPVIAIYQGETKVEQMVFSGLDNLSAPDDGVHGPFKRPFVLAEDTPTEGGAIFSHQAGVYFRYVVNYHVWPEAYCLEKRTATFAPQITEREIGMLDYYASRPGTYDILFYPHSDLEGVGQSNDPAYRVRILRNDVDRPGLGQDRVTAVLEVESRYPITEPRLWL